MIQQSQSGAKLARNNGDSSVRAPVYLTFNGGPDPRHTPHILHLLAEHGVQASFFVRGERAARFAYLVRHMLRDGHTVGHLGWSGGSFGSGRSAAHLRAEVLRSTQVLADILGSVPHLFRAPSGSGAEIMEDEARRLGQEIAGWDIAIPDFWPLARPRRIAASLANAAPGMTVLMHDGEDLVHRPAPLREVLNRYLYELSLRGMRAAPLAAGGCSSTVKPDIHLSTMAAIRQHFMTPASRSM